MAAENPRFEHALAATRRGFVVETTTNTGWVVQLRLRVTKRRPKGALIFRERLASGRWSPWAPDFTIWSYLILGNWRVLRPKRAA